MSETRIRIDALLESSVSCIGDRDGSGSVTVNELLTLVNIALGDAEPPACAHGVPSAVEVNVAVISQAVNNALNGCPSP